MRSYVVSIGVGLALRKSCGAYGIVGPEHLIASDPDRALGNVLEFLLV